MIVVSFDILSWNFPGGTEEIHEKINKNSQDVWDWIFYVQVCWVKCTVLFSRISLKIHQILTCI
jgi:hypothetical protein